MINRLISNLPFNPSLVEQLSFYSNRLKKEKSIRRLGFILIALTMLVQIFAAMVPAERSLAASNNDVVKGGVDNMQQLRNKYNNQADVRGLYQRFGLEAEDLKDGGAQHVSFAFQSQGSQGTRTVGRINFDFTKDQSVGVFAGQKFWSRNASEWQGSTPAFYFGRQIGTDGKYYLVWVLKDCGNIAYRPTEGPQPGLSPNKPVDTPKPTPKPKPTPAPTPTPTTTTTTTTTTVVAQPEVPANIEIKKSAVNKTRNLSPALTTQTAAKAGDVIEYTLITKTTGDKPVQNYTIEDYIGDVLDYADLDMTSVFAQGGKFSSNEKKIIWEKQTIPVGNGLTKTFKVTVKNPIPNTNSPNATAPDFDCRMQNGYGNEVVIKVDCSVTKAVETLPNTGPGTNLAIIFGLTTLSGYFLARNNLISKELWLIRKRYAVKGNA